MKFMDREKVIKALECCKRKDGNECKVCPYTENEYCTEDMAADALALLKEQEAILVDTKVVGTSHGDMEVYCCRDCRTILDPAFHYCPNCGQAVKWE